MIEVIARYKFIMGRHALREMNSAEILGWLFATGFLLLLVFLLGHLTLQDPTFFVAYLNSIGIDRLNSAAIFIVHLFLIPILISGTLQEVRLLGGGENSFILGFSASPSSFFGYKIFSTALGIAPTLAFLIPLVVVYVIFGGQALSLPFFALFCFTLAIGALLIVSFCSALVLFLGILKAKLLTMFRQRTIAFLGILLLAVSVSVMFAPSDTFDFTQSAITSLLTEIYEQSWFFQGFLRFSPISCVIRTSTFFWQPDLAVFCTNIAIALFGLFLIHASTFFALNRFFLKDPGFLLENMQLTQSSSFSTRYFFPLPLLPAIARGILYEEIIHFKRKHLLYFVFTVIPVILFPFFIPEVLVPFLEAQKTLVITGQLLLLILLLTEGFLDDFGPNWPVVQFLGTFPLSVRCYFFTKALIFAMAALFLEGVAFACWLTEFPLTLSEAILIAFAAVPAAILSPFLQVGTGMILRGLRPDERCPGEEKPPLLVLFSSLGILLMVAGFGYSVKIDSSYLLGVMVFLWTLLTWIVFHKGIVTLGGFR